MLRQPFCYWYWSALRRLQPIEFTHLHFKVCKEMFECIADKEKKRVVVNVTYGIGLDQSCSATVCVPCASAEPTPVSSQQVAS